MSTAQIRSVSIAAESSFGNIQSTTGLPTSNTLTFAALECDWASLEPAGDPALNERAEARDGPHGLPPEPDTMWSSGVRVQRRTGSLVFNGSVRPAGDGTVYTIGALPMFQVFRSGMWDAGPPPATADVVSAASTVNRLTAGATTNYQEGGLIGAAVGGRYEVSGVSEVLTATVCVTPAFSGTATFANKQIRMLRTLYVDDLLDPSTLGDSVAVRLDGVGWRTYAYGCRLESLKLAARGKQVYYEATLQAAYIKDINAAGDPEEPSRTDAAPVHFLGSYAVLSSTDVTGTHSSRVESARNRVSVDEWDFTLTNTLRPVGQPDNILGMADMEVVAVDVALNLTLSEPSTRFDGDYQNQYQRQAVLGFAGEMTASNTIAVGNGAAVYVSAGYLDNDPQKRDVSSEIVRQTLTYKAGRYDGDKGTGSSGAKNSMVKIGLGV